MKSTFRFGFPYRISSYASFPPFRGITTSRTARLAFTFRIPKEGKQIEGIRYD
jgi:hypothetical protein